ncbi:MAG: helix-turn-helix domain-containing protein [Candidatus Hodarchaeota archaeon]
MVNLETVGFDSASSRIYNFLLHNVGRILAKTISESLDLPPKAVYAAIKQLEKSDLIETFEDEYPRSFSVKNPSYALSQLTNAQIEKYEQEIQTMKVELDKAQKIFLDQFLEGSCAREITFHYFRHCSIEAKTFLSRHLTDAQNEILLNLVPNKILEPYIEILNDAVNDGIWIGFYILESDLDIISKLDDKIKVFCVDSSEQRFVSVDNNLYASSNVLIDRKRFISIDYDLQSDDWILSSFIDFNIVETIKKDIRKRPFQNARELFSNIQNDQTSLLKQILREKGDQSKQELAQYLQVSGNKLNEIINDLMNDNIVDVKQVTKGKGRPQERVYLVQQK